MLFDFLQTLNGKLRVLAIPQLHVLFTLGGITGTTTAHNRTYEVHTLGVLFRHHRLRNDMLRYQRDIATTTIGSLMIELM